MKRLAFAFLAFCAPALAAPQIALTFDDLPAHSVLPPGLTRIDIVRQTITAMKAAKVPPAYGLINASLIGAEPDAAPVLDLWRQAGNSLGNHTWSHPNLNALTVAAYEAEIVRNETVLTALAGNTDWRWFRYPFLAEGDAPDKRAEIRGFLASRGYKIAPSTMMFGDWSYSEPYARCVARKDKSAIARMEKMYLTAAEAHIGYYRSLSQAATGRDIPYVLLLHIGSFEARMLPKLIALYKAKGFQFVTLEQAEADPYYRAYTDPRLPAPPVDLETAMEAKGLTKPDKPSIYTAELDAICR